MITVMFSLAIVIIINILYTVNMNEMNIHEVPNEEELIEFETMLKGTKLPTNEWTGEEGTKTVQELFNEVNAGETEIEVTPDGEVQRIVHVVSGDITYIDETTGDIFRLKEDRQIFKKDGKVKKRPHLRGAVAEKMKAGEDPTESTIRGIKEELGIAGNFIIGSVETVEEKRETPTYPGLTSTYKIHIVPVKIDKANFKPKGYVEEQEIKTNYFVWEKLPN